MNPIQVAKNPAFIRGVTKLMGKDSIGPGLRGMGRGSAGVRLWGMGRGSAGTRMRGMGRGNDAKTALRVIKKSK